MDTSRADPDLMQRFEELAQRASVRLSSSAEGWEVTVVPRLNPRPILCKAPDLLDAVVAALRQSALREQSLRPPRDA